MSILKEKWGDGNNYSGICLKMVDKNNNRTAENIENILTKMSNNIFIK